MKRYYRKLSVENNLTKKERMKEKRRRGRDDPVFQGKW